MRNPNSRDAADAAPEAMRLLRDGGFDVLPVDCGSPDEATREILRRRTEIDCIVACGGDGTLNSAAQALADTGLPLGIIPAGTANDLARTLQIPTGIAEAVGVILAGQVRSIDLGEVNGRFFFNVASIGLSVELARGLTPDLKRRWGRLGYALAAIKVAVRARPFRATIATEQGTVRAITYQIAVGNGRHYGGGMTVEADAAVDDARLDLYSLELASIWQLALMLADFRKGTHGAWREVRTDCGTRFEITTARPKAVNADGELVTNTPARFAIRPAAVRVFAPA